MFRVDITFADNEDFSHSFRWVDRSGSPIELGSDTLVMQVKAREKDRVPTLELRSDETGIAVVPDETHRFTISIPRGSLRAGSYVFDLLKIDQVDTRVRLAEGVITVEKGITS
ncbi:MAG: hypothetical protein JJ979_17275 [Roseibium sp.]|nr:hypothetical protein [Roseibium sp.]